MNIGNSIKQLRLKKSMNQEKFCTEIGITQSYLSQIENNKRKPSIELLESISKKMNFPMSIMFWIGIESKDIDESKRDAFEILKPSIDNLMNHLF